MILFNSVSDCCRRDSPPRYYLGSNVSYIRNVKKMVGTAIWCRIARPRDRRAVPVKLRGEGPKGSKLMLSEIRSAPQEPDRGSRQ